MIGIPFSLVARRGCRLRERAEETRDLSAKWKVSRNERDETVKYYLHLASAASPMLIQRWSAALPSRRIRAACSRSILDIEP